MRGLLSCIWLIPLTIGCGMFDKSSDDDDDDWSNGGGSTTPADPFDDASTTGTATSDGGTSDGGTSDGGTSDGGTSDGGTSDGGTSDDGTSDGGTSDGGTSDDGDAGLASRFTPRPGYWNVFDFDFDRDECNTRLLYGTEEGARLSSLLTLVEDGFALSFSGAVPARFILEDTGFTASNERVTDFRSGGYLAGSVVPPLDAVLTMTSEVSGSFSTVESATAVWTAVGTCAGGDCASLRSLMGVSTDVCTSESTSLLQWRNPAEDIEDTGSIDGDDTGAMTLEDLAGCSHLYNPVERAGWEKTYTATWVDGAATATERGMGAGYTSRGVPAFSTFERITTSTDEGWEGSVFHGCGRDGGTTLSTPEWNMFLRFSSIPDGAGAAVTVLSTPRTYLADESMIGTNGSWDFNYTMVSSASGLAFFNIPVSGTYTDKGMVEIEVMGELRDAWKIESTHTMELTSSLVAGAYFEWFTRDYPGTAEYYWVEGLGLVYEKHVDTETGTVILEKRLTSVVGL